MRSTPVPYPLQLPWNSVIHHLLAEHRRRTETIEVQILKNYIPLVSLIMGFSSRQI